MARKTYTPEFRAAAVARVRNGERPIDVAFDLNIPDSSLASWRKAAAEGRTLMSPAEKAAAGRAAQSKQRANRIEDLIFLLDRGGETHTDNLSRRTGIPVASIASYLSDAGRTDLHARLVYGDGRPVAPEEREDGERHTRHLLPVVRTAA